MITVINEVKPHEIGGTEISTIRSEKTLLRVMSHWNRNEFVILKFDENEKSITVAGRDLIAAINNAMNTVRF